MEKNRIQPISSDTWWRQVGSIIAGRHGKSVATQVQVSSPCIFGLVHGLHPFPQFWRIKTDLFYFQSQCAQISESATLVTAVVEIELYRDAHLLKWAAAQCIYNPTVSLRLQLTHQFYNKKTSLKTTVARTRKMCLLLTLKKIKRGGETKLSVFLLLETWKNIICTQTSCSWAVRVTSAQ